MSHSFRLILASASPRRRALLEAMNLKFEVFPSNIDEALVDAPDPRSLGIKTAAAKANAVADAFSKRDEAAVVIAADTAVILDGEIFGKPASRSHATEMLRRLSGRTHEVMTGLALKTAPRGELWLDSESSEVTFRALDSNDIEKYIASGEADDKAGAYGVQEGGRKLIARVRGSLSNVIGLPLECFRKGMIQLTNEDPLGSQPEREIIFRAFPDLLKLPFEID